MASAATVVGVLWRVAGIVDPFLAGRGGAPFVGRMVQSSQLQEKFVCI